MSSADTNVPPVQTKATKQLTDKDMARLAERVYRLMLEEVRKEHRRDEFMVRNDT